MPNKKLAKSYKQQAPSGSCDAIVIGSGIGGLTVANLLSRRGRRVLVLERHYTAGGFTHMFKRPGFEWDVGIHYVGEVHDEQGDLRRLFDYLSDGQLGWASLGEVYDRIRFGDNEYPYHAGASRFAESLKQQFGAREDQKAIDTYVKTIARVGKTARPFYLEKAVPGLLSRTVGLPLRAPLMWYARRTTRDVMRGICRNPQLAGVLTGQYGDYGLPPGRSSFGIHGLVAQHFINGAAYPVGGSSRLFETLAPAILDPGGEIFVNAEVSQILVERGRAVGVRMADGAELRSKMVFSDAGANNTYGRLLPESSQRRLPFLRDLQQLRPSIAHVCLYIGLNKTAEQLALAKANYWIFPPTYDHDANIAAYQRDDNAPLPLCYISFPSAKDPAFSARHPGKSTIEIIALVPYDSFSQWDGTRWNKRGEDYEARKEQIAQRLLEQLFRVEPQVKEAIEHYELSTPLTTRHFANFEQGEMYGLAHDTRRLMAPYLRPHTPIRKLYLTGADVCLCGLAGATVSGLIAASAALGRNLAYKALKPR